MLLTAAAAQAVATELQRQLLAVAAIPGSARLCSSACDGDSGQQQRQNCKCDLGCLRLGGLQGQSRGIACRLCAKAGVHCNSGAACMPNSI